MTKKMTTVEEIKQHLEYGDWGKIAKLTGLSSNHVIQTLKRPRSKHYKRVFDTAKKVAEANMGIGL